MAIVKNTKDIEHWDRCLQTAKDHISVNYCTFKNRLYKATVVTGSPELDILTTGGRKTVMFFLFPLNVSFCKGFSAELPPSLDALFSFAPFGVKHKKVPGNQPVCSSHACSEHEPMLF